MEPINPLTEVAEKHRQEDEAMKSPPQQHKHVHPEVIDLKDLRLGKEEDEDTDELGEGDAADHRGPHVGQG